MSVTRAARRRSARWRNRGELAPDLSLPGPVVVNGDYAYVCVHRRPSTPGAFLQAIDISDPSDPVPQGTCELGTSMTFAHTRMVRGGDHLYVGSDALKVVDISSPGAPTVVGSLANYCQGPALDGATLFGAAADLLVTNVSNPANPALLGAVWSTRQLLEGVGVALTPPGPVGGRRYAFAAYDTALGLGHVEIDDVTPPLVYGEESLLRYQGDVRVLPEQVGGGRLLRRLPLHRHDPRRPAHQPYRPLRLLLVAGQGPLRRARRGGGRARRAGSAGRRP